MSTPIDPSTANGRLKLYAVFESNAGKLPTRNQMGAIYAVARAVLPEGYVAVPVAVIERMGDALDMGRYSRAETAMEDFRALLPKEATDEA